ncbi:MAG: hypothetical protein K6U00_09050, partial [Armatimonadetes bacterium]|nr:hypothetical protein [Armatimonadota bacterium]
YYAFGITCSVQCYILGTSYYLFSRFRVSSVISTLANITNGMLFAVLLRTRVKPFSFAMAATTF